MAHKDYSGTPLAKKLGIREGSRVLVLGAPEGFSLGELPGPVEQLARAADGIDVLLMFATARRGLEPRIRDLAACLDRAGRLWVAWPKKASKIATDLTFEEVQSMGLRSGLVDNKSASITDAFQGLQFVYRLKDRST